MSPWARLMTSSRPKIMVRPRATKARATPMIRPSTTCGSTTKCRYATRSSTPMATSQQCESEPIAVVGADCLLARHPADRLEIATDHFNDQHVDDGLVVA